MELSKDLQARQEVRDLVEAAAQAQNALRELNQAAIDRIVQAMVTNFHQPQSTLLLLVSAFIGDRWHQVYDYALSHDFRFLSYGDSSLLIKETE